LPASISAEQSAALLKTLDELAGSNIRIEDTGVEWRVLDDDDVGEAATDPVANEANAKASPANDLRVDKVDELLEESPTPVDQFLTETPPQVDSPEIFEEVDDDEPARTSVDELRFDDNTPLPDDFDLDDESLFAPAPVDEPEDDRDEPADIREEEPQADFDLSEPDEWTDILGEFEGLAEAVAASGAAVTPLETEPDILEDLGEDVVEEPDPEPKAELVGVDEPLDMDSQFALQAEAMGIDLSGMHETLAEPEIGDDVDLELLLEGNNKEGRDIEDLLDEDLVAEISDEGAQLDLIEVEDDEDEEPVEEIEDEEPVEEELVDEAETEEEEEEDEEFGVPPLTKEEQTINMQIDQDLLALAIEDEDGFASTIIIPGDAAEADALKKDKKKMKKGKKDKKGDLDLEDTSAGFETIIMEGEHIRNALDDEKPASHAAAAASLAAATAEREAEMTTGSGKRGVGMIIGILALVLLLTAQALHQSREALAVYPTFNDIAGPLYRAIGMPLSPEWDITGWRFETTRHSVDDVAESENPDGSEDVMIFSRIGNNSDKPLPYPMIGISLTDRYEEPVGGFTLDPADYLANNLDPRKLVEPGNTFNAVMTIRSPSAEATSFRLRACYRNADGSLRCKDDSFK